MADVDAAAIGLIALAIGAAILGFLEMRVLRKKMKERRIRAAKDDSDLPDQAHNAILTTKAIIGNLERQGIQSPEAKGWVHEADVAYERRNYRVVLDLTGRAKSRLLTLKAEHAQKGELAKLEHLSDVGGDEVTTKEILQKEVAPNLPQSKFSIEIAGSAIEQGRAAGRDVTKAIEFLDAAKGRFEAKDYDGALTLARLSKRSADGQPVEAPRAPTSRPQVALAPSGRACLSCGAELAADDAFCRKCGARIEALSCASCGTALLPDDAFCRKCGARVPT